MSKKDKLIERLKNRPKDFTYNEVKTLLQYVGFVENNKGSTSGSRVEFRYINGNKYIIRIHKPHPNNIMKTYQINYIIEFLTKMGVI